jgi:hypothetical protein
MAIIHPTDMTYSLKQTNKGWIITVTENKTKLNYFLWDVEHSKEKYIPYILSYGEYTLGKPFGGGIHPIYFNSNAVKKIDDASKPINIVSQAFKQSVVWSYYRSFITETTPKKIIKQYADEFKTNLQLMGLDGLYQFVQAQA